MRISRSTGSRWTRAAPLLTGGSSLLFTGPLLGAQEQGGTLEFLHQLGGVEPTTTIRVLLLVTIFSVVPSIVLLTTCFPRILILLSFLRRALGAQDLLPNPVVTGMAFVLTAMVMMPVWTEVHDKAYRPLQDGRLKTLDEAIVVAEKPLKNFMFRFIRKNDLLLMVELSNRGAEKKEAAGNRSAGADARSRSAGATAAAARTRGASDRLVVDDLSFAVVLPAFVLSELKTAFQMGFLLYLPFLMIDLVVSAVLLSMGMFMLPPVLVSLPLKVLVFFLADGWNLVVKQLVAGFG